MDFGSLLSLCTGWKSCVLKGASSPPWAERHSFSWVDRFKLNFCIFLNFPPCTKGNSFCRVQRKSLIQLIDWNQLIVSHIYVRLQASMLNFQVGLILFLLLSAKIIPYYAANLIHVKLVQRILEEVLCKAYISNLKTNIFLENLCRCFTNYPSCFCINACTGALLCLKCILSVHIYTTI